MSGSAAPSPTGGASSRKSHAALIISLCINLILVGIIAMAFVRMHFFPPPFGGMGMMEGHGHGMMLRQMQESLTPRAFQHAAPAKSDKIEAIVGAHRPHLRELGASSIDARRKAFEVFSAPKFDRNAFDQSLARVENADAALEKELLSVVSESAVTLSPEERRAVAAERERRGPFMFHQHFRHELGAPPPAGGPAGGPEGGEN